MVLTRSIWTPVLALDRLNSWLRAESSHPMRWCSIRSALKSTIYWTKTKAILEVSKRWHIGMRRVMVKKPCRKCDGTGLWVPWGWMPYDGDYKKREGGSPCRGCRATGTATLKFIETTIGPIRWHTPAEKWYMASLDTYVPFKSYYELNGSADDYYELATNWEPNQSGRPLPLPDVERDMILVLHQWPHEVCFSIDYHHHTKLDGRWNCPNVQAAEKWLRNLISAPSSPDKPASLLASSQTGVNDSALREPVASHGTPIGAITARETF